MGDTEISWTHRKGTRGRTWNPTQGCSLVSEGCRNCYAMRMAARFAEEGWSKGLINLKTRKWNGVVRLAAHKLADPLKWREPSTVFVNSMSDLFHEDFTNEQIAAVFGVMAACPQHTFQILTKRPKRMREWFAWVQQEQGSPLSTCGQEWISAMDVPVTSLSRAGRAVIAPGAVWPLPNVWLGVSVENQAAADERIPDLLATPAAERFLSCEPLLGEVDLDMPRCDDPNHGPSEWGLADDDETPWCIECDSERSYGHWLHLDGGISWVIAGCESGPGARPADVGWFRSLRRQCAREGVAFFLKQATETDLGRCGDDDNPNGDKPCGKRITAHVISPDTAAYSCDCCVEGPEVGACVPIGFGDGSKRKAGSVIELPYLDGVKHAAFPEVP